MLMRNLRCSTSHGKGNFLFQPLPALYVRFSKKLQDCTTRQSETSAILADFNRTLADSSEEPLQAMVTSIVLI